MKAGLLLAVALTASACPVDPPVGPPAGPEYHAGALAPGNRIYLSAVPDSRGWIISNPGGVTEYPGPGNAALELNSDLIGAGNPVTGAAVCPVGATGRIAMCDDQDAIVHEFGDHIDTWAFSADGSTFALARFVDQPTAAIEVYNTSDLSLRRTIPWPTDQAVPRIAALSRDGSRVMAHGWNPAFPAADLATYTATTSGSDAFVIAIPASGKIKSQRQFAGNGRIGYFAAVPGQPDRFDLRAIGTDGSGERALGRFEGQGSGSVPHLATEIGTGRIIIEADEAGSSTRARIIAVDDSAAATQTLIAGPFASVSLAPLVRPAP